MKDVFRDLVIHHSMAHRLLLERWKPGVPHERLGAFVDALLLDGLWLSKFPLLCAPTYGVARLDQLDKARMVEDDPTLLGLEAAALRPRVDADLLRFVLSLSDEVLLTRVEIFFGGRAMNKPLWNYLNTWFERAAVLRTALGSSPGLFDTVYR